MRGYCAAYNCASSIDDRSVIGRNYDWIDGYALWKQSEVELYVLARNAAQFPFLLRRETGKGGAQIIDAGL